MPRKSMPSWCLMILQWVRSRALIRRAVFELVFHLSDLSLLSLWHSPASSKFQAGTLKMAAQHGAWHLKVRHCLMTSWRILTNLGLLQKLDWNQKLDWKLIILRKYYSILQYSDPPHNTECNSYIAARRYHHHVPSSLPGTWPSLSKNGFTWIIKSH